MSIYMCVCVCVCVYIYIYIYYLRLDDNMNRGGRVLQVSHCECLAEGSAQAGPEEEPYWPDRKGANAAQTVLFADRQVEGGGETRLGDFVEKGSRGMVVQLKKKTPDSGYTYLYLDLYLSIYLYLYTYTYIYIYIYIYIHTHIYVYREVPCGSE